MFALLFPFLLRVDSVALDSMQVDTMREVTVRAGKHIPLPGMVITPRLKEEVIPPPSLGTILEKLSRSLKALDNFNKIKTFDELLQEAYEQQMRIDSLAKNSSSSNNN